MSSTSAHLFGRQGGCQIVVKLSRRNNRKVNITKNKDLRKAAQRAKVRLQRDTVARRIVGKGVTINGYPWKEGYGYVHAVRGMCDICA